MDAVDQYNLDVGEEWPDSEDGGIAQYRRFFQVRRQFLSWGALCFNCVIFLPQSWIGVVQGACPVSKRTAIKLAGLLVQVYYGDRCTAVVWPPPDLE